MRRWFIIKEYMVSDYTEPNEILTKLNILGENSCLVDFDVMIAKAYLDRYDGHVGIPYNDRFTTTDFHTYLEGLEESIYESLED